MFGDIRLVEFVVLSMSQQLFFVFWFGLDFLQLAFWLHCVLLNGLITLIGPRSHTLCTIFYFTGFSVFCGLLMDWTSGRWVYICLAWKIVNHMSFAELQGKNLTWMAYLDFEDEVHAERFASGCRIFLGPIFDFSIRLKPWLYKMLLFLYANSFKPP